MSDRRVLTEHLVQADQADGRLSPVERRSVPDAVRLLCRRVYAVIPLMIAIGVSQGVDDRTSGVLDQVLEQWHRFRSR